MSQRGKRSASSSRWLSRQRKDPYARAAREENRRSRASFKLEQIDRSDRLFRRGQRVLDLGAAPGGWSQYLAKVVGADGLVVAVDLLPIRQLDGVLVIQGDFLDAAVRQRIEALLPAGCCDFVVSDMAPNLSGIKVRDEARAEELVLAALDVSAALLRPGGGMVVKVFESGNARELLDAFRARFGRVVVRKPGASRQESAERFVVARGYNPDMDGGSG